MSERQLPVYYEWNGTRIKAKGKIGLLNSFYDSKHIEFVTINSGKTCKEVIENLKKEYVLGYLENGKVKEFTRESYKANKLLKKGKYVLCKIENEYIIPVIANPKKVGTPRMYLIKGQDIYSGNLREHMRGFVMDKIKECYKPYIKDLKPIIDYPVKITCIVYDTIKNFYDKDKSDLGGRWDMDNLMYPYLKAFPDLLTKENILLDDDRLHIPSTIGAVLVPIDNHEDRKLVFIIEKDDRQELSIIKEYHKNKETFETEDLDLVKDEEFEPFGEIKINFIPEIKNERI